MSGIYISRQWQKKNYNFFLRVNLNKYYSILIQNQYLNIIQSFKWLFQIKNTSSKLFSFIFTINNYDYCQFIFII